MQIFADAHPQAQCSGYDHRIGPTAPTDGLHHRRRPPARRRTGRRRTRPPHASPTSRRALHRMRSHPRALAVRHGEQRPAGPGAAHRAWRVTTRRSSTGYSTPSQTTSGARSARRARDGPRPSVTDPTARPRRSIETLPASHRSTDACSSTRSVPRNTPGHDGCASTASPTARSTP